MSRLLEYRGLVRVSELPELAGFFSDLVSQSYPTNFWMDLYGVEVFETWIQGHSGDVMPINPLLTGDEAPVMDPSEGVDLSWNINEAPGPRVYKDDRKPLLEVSPFGSEDFFSLHGGIVELARFALEGDEHSGFNAMSQEGLVLTNQSLSFRLENTVDVHEESTDRPLIAVLQLLSVPTP